MLRPKIRESLIPVFRSENGKKLLSSVRLFVVDAASQVKTYLSLSTVKVHGGVKVKLHSFLTFALDGGVWSSSLPGGFAPVEKSPGVYFIVGCVDPCR